MPVTQPESEMVEVVRFDGLGSMEDYVPRCILYQAVFSKFIRVFQGATAFFLILYVLSILMFFIR